MAVNKKKLNSEISQALFSDTERFEMFFAAHWKKVSIAALVVAVAVAVGFYAAGAKQRAERRAACVLADARTVGDLEKSLREYPDAPGAALAQLRLARLYADGKQYDKALKALQQVANNTEADLLLRNNAQLDAAYMMEMTGNLQAAAQLFGQLANNRTLPVARRTEANYNAARLYIDLKDTAKAQAILKLAVATPKTDEEVAFWVGRSKSLLIALECGELSTAAPKAAKKAARPTKK